VQYAQKYDWVPRLVCILERGHEGDHQNRIGWRWADDVRPYRGVARPGSLPTPEDRDRILDVLRSPLR
jgi:hypothetical protein